MAFERLANGEPVGAEAAPPGFRPLYRQVKEVLLRRIADQTWQPGDLIPSEQQIAAELGVSQGTVRKALDEMTLERLLTRRQGRGTFVARHDEARILFQFFKIVPNGGQRVFPESELKRVENARAEAEEREKLHLGAGERVIRFHRLRSLAGNPTIVEHISLPARLFPGLGETISIENNLYELYANRFGITVAGGEERIRAKALPAEDAALIGLAPGTPILAIDRIAISIDGIPVEWRQTLCHTADCAYVSELR
jgi:GntR family transcriptional regulator